MAQAIAHTGALLVFLEPYDPVNMPVELAYGGVKEWLKRNHSLICDLPADTQIRLGMGVVGRQLARSAFHESGYL